MFSWHANQINKIRNKLLRVCRMRKLQGLFNYSLIVEINDGMAQVKL